MKELIDLCHEVGFDACVSSVVPLVQGLCSDAELPLRIAVVKIMGDLAGFLIQSDPERGDGY